MKIPKTVQPIFNFYNESWKFQKYDQNDLILPTYFSYTVTLIPGSHCLQKPIFSSSNYLTKLQV